MLRRLASITIPTLLIAGGCALDFKVLDTTGANGGGATATGSTATTGGGNEGGSSTPGPGGSDGSGGDCCDCDGDGFRSNSKACGGRDCADRDALAHPGQDRFFTDPIYGAPKGARYDYDCDGHETHQYDDVPLNCPPITLDCDASTRWFGAAPACGETGSIGRCQAVFIFCVPIGLGSRQQGCR